MSVYFEHPEALALLLVLVAALWTNRGSLADHTPLQRVLTCVVRCTVLALLSLGLAAPHLEQPTRRLAAAVLVDVSASVSQEDAASAATFAGELQERLGKDRVQVIAFDRRARQLEGDGIDLSVIDRKDREGTDIERAITLALASFPAGHVGRIILCSDGLSNVGSATYAAGEARERDVPILVRPYGAGVLPEVLIEGVDLPHDVQPGSSLAAQVHVVSSTETPGVLTVFRNKWKAAQRQVQLSPGRNTFSFDMEVPEGSFLDVSALVSSQADRYADNNYGRAIVPVKSEGRVLYVENDEREGRHLYRALTSRSFKVDLRGASGFPTSLAELQNYDLVILSSVAAHELPEGALDVLEVYVRDLGGGLLTLGGEKSYGMGGYANTKLARLLPVEMVSHARQDLPSLALMLVIDKSGSMARDKIELAKSAAIASAELLTSNDYLGVISFDNSAYTVSPVTTAGEAMAIIARIHRLRAGGGTNIFPALEKAHEELLSVPARLKHVILLSDGKSGGSGHNDLVTRMSADRITVSTVAVGQESDRTLLREIAGAGKGRYYFTDDPTNIPQIFVKETLTAQQNAIVEEPFIPSVTKDAEVLRGIPWEEAPPLYGYVTVSARPLAEVLLATDRAEPLLARWRLGLGKVASYTSDTTSRWAGDWIEWPYFQTFFSQIARDTMRTDPNAGRVSVSLSLEEDQARVVVDLTDDSGAFVNGVDTSATVVRPSLEVMRTGLGQVAPGRYAGRFDSSEIGPYLLRIELSESERVLASLQSGLTRGYPLEYAGFGTDEALLRDLAETSGGDFIETVSDALAPDSRVAVRDLDLSPLLLAGALVLFLADVLVRRLRFPE